MIDLRCTLFIFTLNALLPSHRGCMQTIPVEDVTVTTIESTLGSTVGSTTVTTSTATTTVTTSASPCPSLASTSQLIFFLQTSPTFIKITDFFPTSLFNNPVPAGTTFTAQCGVTVPGETTPTGMTLLGTAVQVTTDSGAVFVQDVDNGGSGSELFDLTCLPSGSYEFGLRTPSKKAVTISSGGSGFLHCLGCPGPSGMCKGPTG